jgi:myosin I
MLKQIERSLIILCIFQLLFGAADADLSKYHLSRDVEKYFYVDQGKAAKVRSISDRNDYKATQSAFRTLAFSDQEIDTVWKTVAAILHLVIIISIMLIKN